MGKKVPKSELVEIFGVAPNTITNYKRAGMPSITTTSRGKKDVYDTADCIAWWVERQILSRFGDKDISDQIDKEYEQGRLARAQADGKEIENQIKRGELAPVSFISEVLSKVTSQVAAVLDSIPQKIKRRVPGLTANDIEIIKKEIIKTQNAAAKVDVNVEELIASFIRNKGGIKPADKT